ncbi:MAG: YtxH domain-containing protein [Aeromicrobium sp.]
MAGKLTFLVGAAAGYVLGTRSGRERYDQMMGQAQRLWKDPRVQDATEKVQHAAQEHMPGSSSGSPSGSRTSGYDTGGTGR